MAKSKIMIDNFRTRVTEWKFEPGEETGQHIHEYDYVVVPMADGVLKIINEDGSITFSELKKAGIKPQISGRGLIVSQSIEAGTKVEKKSICILKAELKE